MAPLMREFHKIWIDQCEAARDIREAFGVQKALGYLIGEKLLNFLRAADQDPEVRLAEFQRRTARAYDAAKAVNAAAGGGLDDVIDPAETRDWIAQHLKRLPPAAPRTGKKYPCIDPW